jgi:hypothetical protein
MPNPENDLPEIICLKLSAPKYYPRIASMSGCGAAAAIAAP